MTVAVGFSEPWSVRLASAELPRALDDRLSVELFAEHPQLVTPTGLAIDARGRVFVAESHTHFRPDDYDGPPADRILILADTDGDGRADTKTIFHEGFTYVMDIEFHSDGSLYVATRMEIHRLRDTDGDDRADDITRIVRMETKGNYPHNGLSGIAFDLAGGFHFGLGENLGESYTLFGSDGSHVSGGGEGGSTYWVDELGRQLRRVSTGWWNPYGMCIDSFGRVFGTDNDPDASPPCRLIQVVPGADYGYEFRYGRSGRNPLVAWDGEIPGTLPMVAGTGEAPCHIVAYESHAFPQEYFGQLLVPSWADHRVERYPVVQTPGRGLVTTERQTLVAGPDDFRPVGIDVAPDGSVYVSDWVSSSYALHKQGRIWRIGSRRVTTSAPPTDPLDAVQAADRRQREAAARELARTPTGRQRLEVLASAASLPAARATCLRMLSAVGQTAVACAVARNAAQPIEVRVIAAYLAGAADGDVSLGGESGVPKPVRAAALLAGGIGDIPAIAPYLDDSDPMLRHAAIVALARSLGNQHHRSRPLPELVAGLPELSTLLAVKRSRDANRDRAEQQLEDSLRSDQTLVRFAAVKWIADDRLTRFAPQLESMLDEPRLDLANFLAVHVALLRLGNQPTLDRPPPARLVEKIFDDQASLAIRRLCLRLVDPAFPGLPLEKLTRLLDHPDAELRGEAIQTLGLHPDARRLDPLLKLAQDPRQPRELQALAVAALPAPDPAARERLVELASGNDAMLRDEALRSLVGAPLTESQLARLRRIQGSKSTAEAVARVLDKSLPVRPPIQDVPAWLELIAAPGDRSTGERIFFGRQVGTCSKCHQSAGRGAAVGPDLSRISERLVQAGDDGRRWLLETILQPSRDMAPQYTPWVIVTKEGKQHLGLPRRKGGNSEAYLGQDGREFTLKKQDIEFSHESEVSIMPADLLQQLTASELADLFAFLTHQQSSDGPGLSKTSP